MKIKDILSFAAFATMVVAFVMFVASVGIRISPPEGRSILSMKVPDISSMVVGSSVLLRGVSVGEVTGIESSADDATINFYIEGQYDVPIDSEVRIENLSALGEAYISVTPRTLGGPTLQDGDRIPQANVISRPSVSELGVSVSRALGEVDPMQLSDVIDEADSALPDTIRVLPNLARASNLLRNMTLDFNGAGGQAIDNLQRLLENAGWLGAALADQAPYIRNMGPGITRTWNNQANISLRTDSPGSVYIFGRMLQRIQTLLDDRGPDIRVLTEALMGNVEAIAGSLGAMDMSRVLTNLLHSVPEDGAIELHIQKP